MRLATLSLALRLRGLALTSDAVGVSAPLITGLSVGVWLQVQKGDCCPSESQIQSDAAVRKKFFTIRSSSEWYEITTILPPVPITFTACSKPAFSATISSLTAILSA